MPTKSARPKVAKSPRPKAITRSLIGLIFAILCISILTGKRAYRWELREEDVSQQNVYAPFDFVFDDEKATSKLQAEAAAEVVGVYDRDPKVGQDVLKDISSFYERISGLEEERDDITDLPISNLLVLLKNERKGELHQKTAEICASILGEGLMSETLKGSLRAEGIIQITVRDPTTGAEFQKEVAQILTPDEAKKALSGLAQALFPRERRVRKEVAFVVGKFLLPNLLYNEARTIELRKTAMEGVSPILKKVRKGQLIVEKGQVVTADHILQLKELGRRRSRRETLASLSGVGLLVFFLVGLMGVYLRRYSPKIFANDQNLILVGVAMLFPLTLAKLITFSQLSSNLISVSCGSLLICGSMLVTILLEPALAIMVTVTLAVFAGIMGGIDFQPALITFVGGLVGVYSVLEVRRRWQLIRAGALVGLANMACIVGIGLLGRTEARTYIASGAWGLAFGVVAAFIVTGVLPIFESLFKITTNISLLELSDLNHPLLRRLVMETPGTYHHSLIVGNLAESAASEVGANPLLARVASYYHDIGKIDKAEYFSENLPKGERKSKHDKLAPSMSNLIIINHVKKGVELARQHKLNQAIIDIIKEHHGTSQVFYFYQRALERVTDEEELKKLEFRYPGPIPQTKESAIVLLADSIEAASRTLSEPTPSSIKGMVRKIINNKFIDGQLEQCELTLKNLNSIAESFSRILTGIFHTRIEYPERLAADISPGIAGQRPKEPKGRERQ